MTDALRPAPEELGRLSQKLIHLPQRPPLVHVNGRSVAQSVTADDRDAEALTGGPGYQDHRVTGDARPLAPTMQKRRPT